MPKPKKTSLSSALAAAASGKETAAPKDRPKRTVRKKVATTIGANTDRPDRAGRVNITGYFDPSVKQSIRLIQAQHPELSQQAILAEALNLVFSKYGVPESAEV